MRSTLQSALLQIISLFSEITYTENISKATHITKIYQQRQSSNSNFCLTILIQVKYSKYLMVQSFISQCTHMIYHFLSHSMSGKSLPFNITSPLLFKVNLNFFHIFLPIKALVVPSTTKNTEELSIFD